MNSAEPIRSFGAYSTASTLLRDLIPAVAEAIENLGGEIPKDIQQRWNHMAGNDELLDEYYTSEESQFDYEDLFALANDLCPPYICYGGIEGDPACVGIWIDYEAINEEKNMLKPAIVEVKTMPSINSFVEKYKKPYPLILCQTEMTCYEYKETFEAFSPIWMW